MNATAPFPTFSNGWKRFQREPLCFNKMRSGLRSSFPPITATFDRKIGSLHPTLTAKPLVVQPDRWPLWKKVLVGAAGLAAVGIAAVLGAKYLTDRKTAPCRPGFQPDCSGPRLVKKIVLGTAEDDGGNPMRKEIVDLVNQNHEEYAKIHGYEHLPVSKSLVEGKCLDPDLQTPVDCVPYWNKIEMFRQWLAEPQQGGGVEEWRVFFDSDMPVTNWQIKLEDAIDVLRDKDTSVIVTRDGLNWQKKIFSNPNFAINTGLLIVRKDEAAKELFDAIWARRNDLVNTGDHRCLSLGTCKNQSSLHEQEALSDLLHAEPLFADRVVSIVQARDSSSFRRGHIALNTYERSGGCFKRKQDGWPDAPLHFVYHRERDPDSNWVPGDFTGQTPAIPIWGQELPFINGKCVGDWKSAPFSKIRKIRIENMIRQTVR